MRETKYLAATSVRSLLLLEAVIEDKGVSSLSAIARKLGMPVASAHRHAQALIEAAYLIPTAYGRHAAGARLRALARLVDEQQLVVASAAPILDRLASLSGCVVQLGTLENEMVTYRLKTGRGAGDLFTKVGMQLEAYCSAIGKVLLAHLSADAQSAYLASGPFVALTDRTITEPHLLKAELDQVRAQGFAIDDEEVVAGLQCVAVPILDTDGAVIAALSASCATNVKGPLHRDELIVALKRAASEIIV